jgi:hypothetical protein
MLWVRKLFVAFVSIIFLVALLGVALSTSAKTSLTSTPKLENWLSNSGLYGELINNASSQAQSALGSTNTQISGLHSALKQAAMSSFTKQDFNSDLNTFIKSNQSWLEGKTKTPNFSIDLTTTKQTFANNLNQYFQGQLISLPSCTLSQTKELTNIDPLQLDCLPLGTSVASLVQLVNNEVVASGAFLNNPVITAASLNQNNNNQGEPYYQKLSKAPNLYKQALHVPLVLGIISVICIPIIIFASPRKRRGLRRTAGTLVTAGALLVVIKLTSDAIIKKIDHKFITKSSTGMLQQALLNFAKSVEQAMVKIDLGFAIGYFILALLVLLSLLAIRNRQSKQPKSPKQAQLLKRNDNLHWADRLNPTKPNINDSIPRPMNNGPRPSPSLPSAPLYKPKPKPTKKRRNLIQ